MADFAKALGRTLKNEGTYSLDPADPGGETVFGISRRWHPEWTGWATIDSLKPRVGTIDPNDIIASALIKHDVEAFYKSRTEVRFGNRLSLDVHANNRRDQLVCERLFVRSRIRFDDLQQSVHVKFGDTGTETSRFCF